MARNAVSCGHDDDTGEAFGCSRPLSGSRTATIGIVAWFRFCRPILVVGRCIGFAVVMAQVRRPVPFRTRKLRPGRGDGTALERVWESSTPPHSTSGFPSSVTLREPPFFYPLASPFHPSPGPCSPWQAGVFISRHLCIAWSVGVTVINDVMMLMYGKEASNRKQEIDRQHYTIPNQRPKDKHFEKI